MSEHTAGWNIIRCADHAEWLAKRHDYLTASDVAAVMGLSRYGSRAGILNAKAAPPKPEFSSDAMRAGQFQEAGVFRWFLDGQQRAQAAMGAFGGELRGALFSELLDGSTTSKAVVVHRDPALRLAATPDALLWCAGWPGGVLVEVKVTNPKAWAEDWGTGACTVPKRWLEYGEPNPTLGHCPLRHWVQLQTQLLVTGAGAGWVVGACGTVKLERLYPAHPAFQAHITRTAREFAVAVDAERAARMQRGLDVATVGG
jgi:hypothetical protein